IGVAGIVDDPSALRPWIDRSRLDGVVIDVVLAEAASPEQIADWGIGRNQPPFLILVADPDEKDMLNLLSAGVRAVLPRTADGDDILAAVKMIAKGNVVLPSELLAALLDGRPISDESLRSDAGRAQLTPRELEVLAAMADGASNKAIARRLGISFHTA